MSDQETPTWRYLVPGVLFLGMAGYLLATGEIAVDKQRSVIITRSANPLIYWTTVVVAAAIGAAAMRKVWKRLTS